MLAKLLVLFSLLFGLVLFSPPLTQAECVPLGGWGECFTGSFCTTNGLCCLAGECPAPPVGADEPVVERAEELSPLCADGISVNTAIGCLAAGDPKIMISQILGWSVILGGGIAFLLIIYAGFQITTAAGDPKRVKAAQEILTSAIGGLLLIIFSILLLNFIGIKILNLGTWFNL